jgi:hypothetical protein
MAYVIRSCDFLEKQVKKVKNENVIDNNIGHKSCDIESHFNTPP